MASRLLKGLPIGGQWVLDMAAFAVFTTLVARMGDASMAASQAFISLPSLSFMQASGLSVAAATLVGRYVGAGDPTAAERSFRTALGLAAALGASVALLFVAIPETLLGLFSEDADVLSLGGPLLALGAGFQLLDALGKDELAGSQALAEHALLQQGVTFSVYGDSRGTEKIFPFCLLPRLIAGSDWAVHHFNGRSKIVVEMCKVCDIGFENRVALWPTRVRVAWERK